ncbi:MAG TPA: histidine phosphatase family protein [Acidimicrobiales bacterium]|jgi:phosphohistidine phosphatase
MKHIWILRHGKAAADGPDGDDHSRPLTGRGRRQTSQVAEHMAEAVASGAATPDLVLSSSAARALTTAQPVHAVLGSGVPLEVERDLYQADPDDIVDRLRLLTEDTKGVMIVGHNPTFHDLALLLVSPDDTDGRARLKDGFPTAATARVALNVTTWSEVAAGCGLLEELFVPSR